MITLRGTKKACAAARVAILAIVDSVEDETTVTIKIEPKFHRTIIGGGGFGLKNLLARVSGPTNPKEQAGLRGCTSTSRHSLIQEPILIDLCSPQPPNDEVVIRGEKNLVKNVAAELERCHKPARAGGYWRRHPEPTSQVSHLVTADSH
jgi:hypothetical protein